MPTHLIIDGNNLLHAMHEHAPMPHVGRETLVRIIEQWARDRDGDVTVVFDGAAPPGAFAQQISSRRITVRFSAPVTADDIIVDMIGDASDPGSVRIVSSDRAIRLEARHRRCRDTKSETFVEELCPPPPRKPEPIPEPPTKPAPATDGDTGDWLETFGFDPDTREPFDGHDAMQH